MNTWRIQKFESFAEQDHWDLPGNLSPQEVTEILRRLAARYLTEEEVISSSLRASHKSKTDLLERVGSGPDIHIGDNPFYLAQLISGQKLVEAKTCPECGHVFKGNGWDGIDAHWRAKHEDIMSYEQAWPLLQAGKYVKTASCEPV